MRAIGYKRSAVFDPFPAAVPVSFKKSAKSETRGRGPSRKHGLTENVFIVTEDHKIFQVNS